MKKRDRVFAAIRGEEVDHVPCGFSLHFPHDRAFGDASVEAHLRFFKETDTDIMKIMNAKNKFTANHPKFVAFLNAVFSREMEEGTVIEITLTRPGEEPMTTNMKIRQSDLDLMRELQDMAKNQ